MKDKRWYERPMAIMGHMMDAEGVDVESQVRLKRELGFDAEHWLAADLSSGGDDGRSYFFKTAAGFAQDKLSEYLPIAHRAGLRVLIYLNVHWFNEKFNPEWMQVDAEGKRIGAGYGAGYLACVNSPFEGWAAGMARDLGKYDIDGVFLDGPIFHGRGCFCEFCARRFKEFCGLELPTRLPARQEGAMDKKTRLKFMEFRRASSARFIRRFREALRSENPEAILYANGCGLRSGVSSGQDNRRLLEFQDMLGAEGGFVGYGPLEKTPIWKPEATAKLLETQSVSCPYGLSFDGQARSGKEATGKPTVIFIDHAYKGYDYYAHTAAEVRLLYAQTIASGANPWFHTYYRNRKTPATLAGKEMNYFLKKNREHFEGTTSAARLSLFWSDRTADFYEAVEETDFTSKRASQRPGNFQASFYGAYDSPYKSQIPFDIIDEKVIEDGVGGRYSLIILPNVACMSEAVADGVKEFVKDGGNIIASFETSLFDETGERLNNFRLAEVFGVNATETLFGPSKIDYITLYPDHPITKEIEQDLIPSPSYYRRVRTRPPAEDQSQSLPEIGWQILARFRGRLPARYAPLPPTSADTAIMLNSFGKGKCIYIAGNMFEHYWGFKFPEYREIIAAAANWLSPPRIYLDKGLGLISIVVRSQPARAGKEKSRLCLHLINAAGGSRPLEAVLPFEDVGITLETTARPVSVRALVLDEELDFEFEGATLNVVLPRLEEYEVVVIDFGGGQSVSCRTGRHSFDGPSKD